MVSFIQLVYDDDDDDDDDANVGGGISRMSLILNKTSRKFNNAVQFA